MVYCINGMIYIKEAETMKFDNNYKIIKEFGLHQPLIIHSFLPSIRWWLFTWSQSSHLEEENKEYGLQNDTLTRSHIFFLFISPWRQLAHVLKFDCLVLLKKLFVDYFDWMVNNKPLGKTFLHLTSIALHYLVTSYACLVTS